MAICPDDGVEIAVSESPEKVPSPNPVVAIVIEPAPLVIAMPVPAVRVARVGPPVPSPMRSCPFESTELAVMAPVPEPKSTPPSVRVVAPVPPFATGSVPVTSLVRSIDVPNVVCRAPLVSVRPVPVKSVIVSAPSVNEVLIVVVVAVRSVMVVVARVDVADTSSVEESVVAPLAVSAANVVEPATPRVPLREAFAALSVPVSVGDAENTTEPDPVSSVSAEAKFAELGVERKVAMPVPKPDTPVEIGSPVASARLKAGVASVPPNESCIPP